MKTLVAAAVSSFALTPIVTDFFTRFRRGFIDALRVRAEVSAMMAESYRRLR
jgi:hypothetical protein